MAIIANVSITNTFDEWRTRTNQVSTRMNAFALTESSLFANTITANTKLVVKAGAVVKVDGTIVGTLSIPANTTVSGNLVSTGKTVIEDSLSVSANANFGGSNTDIRNKLVLHGPVRFSHLSNTFIRTDRVYFKNSGASNGQVLQIADSTTGEIEFGDTSVGDGAITETKIASGNVTTVKLNTGAVTEAKIADANVTSAKINTGAVTTAKINTGAVTEAKIADANVTSSKINTGAVTSTKIGSEAVTAAKIADANVTTAKINTGAVTAAKIGSSAVTTAKINTGAVTLAKISSSAKTALQEFSHHGNTINIGITSNTTVTSSHRGRLLTLNPTAGVIDLNMDASGLGHGFTFYIRPIGTNNTMRLIDSTGSNNFFGRGMWGVANVELQYLGEDYRAISDGSNWSISRISGMPVVANSGLSEGLSGISSDISTLSSMGGMAYNDWIGVYYTGNGSRKITFQNFIRSWKNMSTKSSLANADRLNILDSAATLGPKTANVAIIKDAMYNHVISANGVATHRNNTYEKSQRGQVVTLGTVSGSQSLNLANGNHYSMTLNGATTLANPSNPNTGQSGSIFIKQDGTGSRTMAFGSAWEFPSGTAPTLTTTANAVDRLDYVVYGSANVHAVLSTAIA